ncbi:MAG: recombination-associated protein RdgC [Desulfovibrio sp.]|jgi:DNA recombination-dependent growth factor C|nr:recombination-associated protein RdgC [Desulfovibrio sp.]
MSFTKTSTSFTRYRLAEPVPASLWPEVPDRLRRFAFQDIDDLPEERSFGWTAFEDMLDTLWHRHPADKGAYLAFSLRLDTRRVPPGVIKKHVAVALRKEEDALHAQGKKFIARERKKEIREQVVLRLRQRFLPIPAQFEVVWNTAASTLLFTSTQQKMRDMFEELFVRTFDLHLTSLTPYELAAGLLPDAVPLELLEPTRFA